MFLALKEMRYSKWRYALVMGVIFLVSYMVFMMSGLATGLSSGHKKAIDDWNASSVVLTEDANKVFGASQLTRGDLDRVSTASSSDKSGVGLYQGSVTKGSTKENISLFGSDASAFTTPAVTQGTNYSGKYDITISQNLVDEGFAIGDTVRIGNLDHDLTITGIFKSTTYSVVPVIYTSLDTWTSIKYGTQPFNEDASKPLNAVVIRGTSGVTIDNSTATRQSATAERTGSTAKLQKLDMATFVNNVPGVSAEALTFNGMIGLLVVITAAIVGIFMYVITLQKTAIFGVMKAEGVRTGFIARSVVAQSFVVGVASVAIAYLLAWLSSLAFPAAMPFVADLGKWALYGVLLVVVTVVGGLFSVRTVARVDPITAMGEE
ncbi:MAG: ABC transporter permease [Bifidobacteriaceae bacterium]|jgi:putative ABC transport system permease protein|nr:ABC transporter permease [Bifidobacteriaceae bacterium]